MEEFGIVGLGRIGANLARQGLEKGMRVAGSTRGDAPQDLVDQGLVEIRDTAEFREQLKPPRFVLVYVPAGPAVDQVLDDLADHLEKGDVIADGGNSYWGDSIRRHKRLARKELRFVDVGTSGGVDGARNGACFMAGGDDAAVGAIEPVLKKLAVKGGYVHAGPAGAGHFVKLVHNGIEFGMLQAIGEGIDLLERYHEALPVADVLKCWRNGSVIRSWLIDLMEEQYRDKGGMGGIPPYVEDTGEVNWLVADALRMETPVPVIAQAVMSLLASRDENQNWARAIAMMRHGFGGHPFGADEDIARERGKGRAGDFYREPE
jgi:6-phosphogluconate dehydrogenase